MKQYRLIISLVLAIILALILRGCFDRKCPEVVSVKIDTVYIPQKADTIYKPVPYAVYLKGKQLPTQYLFDTLYLPEQIPDSECVAYYNQLKDYFSRTYLYKDSFPNKYGKIYIDDTVTQNKIIGRGLRTNLLIPEITKTVTMVVPPRNELYIGGNLLGNEKNFLKGYEAGLIYRSKFNYQLSFGYQQIFNGNHYYKIGYYHKISLKK